jgi:rfaE bifunctional protein nucleotidyltransferase chain/domain
MNTKELIEGRIQDWHEAKQNSFRWRYLEETVVFTNGCFDLLHRGHLEYLMACKDMGDRLIVGLNSDSSVKKLKGANRPVNSQEDRALALASLMFVDAVVLFDEDTPEALIKELNPHKLVKGGDYAVEEIAGAAWVKSNGCEVQTIPFIEGYSTTELIEKIQGEKQA